MHAIGSAMHHESEWNLRLRLAGIGPAQEGYHPADSIVMSDVGPL